MRLTSSEIIKPVAVEAGSIHAASPVGVNLTVAAVEKVTALLGHEGRGDLRLRLAVQPGGCSGLRYQLFFDDRLFDDDQVTRFGDADGPVYEPDSGYDSGYESGSDEERISGAGQSRRVAAKGPRRNNFCRYGVSWGRIV
jgi:hypothetical protein